MQTYIDHTIMEEETKNGRNGDEGLFDLLLDNLANDLLNIWASFGVVVWTKSVSYTHLTLPTKRIV